MFLERFLVANLWNAGLICVMFGLKKVIQSRVSLRFHYYSWFILLASLLISFLPTMVWNDLPSLISESQQTMATYNIASTTDAAIADGTQWVQDTTQLFLEDSGNIQFEFFIQSFNRFLIISLDVLICRYSPSFRAFPALFISEEPHKSFYYPSCFRSQK